MTQTDNSFVSLIEYNLSVEEFQRLPSSYKALLSSVCFSVNEINELSCIFLSSGFEPADPLVHEKWAIQRNSLMRVLAAKIFKAMAGIEEFRKTIQRSPNRDDKILEILKKEMEQLSSLKKERGYRLAAHIRNNVTNHIKPQKVKSFLKHLPKRPRLSLFLHKSQGDSFYPLGEISVFSGAINQFAKQEGISGQTALEEWLDWTHRASAVVVYTLNNIGIDLITSQFPEKYGLETEVPVERKFLEGFNNKPLALFSTEQGKIRKRPE